MGIGAFNLVRAETYRAAGGHAPLRLTVNEDWRLGLLLRRAGGSTRVFLGAPDLEVDWFRTAGGMVRALEKSSFASLDYRTARLLRVVPWMALWLAGVFGLWTVAVPVALLARRMYPLDELRAGNYR